jgi:hypothetical protein
MRDLRIGPRGRLGDRSCGSMAGSVSDGLPKLKDFPAELGGSGKAVAE